MGLLNFIDSSMAAANRLIDEVTGSTEEQFKRQQRKDAIDLLRDHQEMMTGRRPSRKEIEDLLR